MFGSSSQNKFSSPKTIMVEATIPSLSLLESILH